MEAIHDRTVTKSYSVPIIIFLEQGEFYQRVHFKCWKRIILFGRNRMDLQFPHDTTSGVITVNI